MVKSTERHCDDVKHFISEIIVAHNEHYSALSNIICKKIDNSSIQEHSSKTLTRLKDKLIEIGSSLDDVLMVYLYVADMSEYPIINSVYGRFFETAPPARVCLEVQLDHPGDIFKMSCVALHKKSEDVIPLSMHVQSISDWAPANIGPYSQSINYNGLVYISGCIGLIPSTMELTTSGLQQEADLSLTHVQSIAEASDACQVHDAASCFCYVINQDCAEYARKIWNNRKNEQSIEMHCFQVSSLPRNANFEWHLIVPTATSSRTNLRSDNGSCCTVASNPEDGVSHCFVVTSSACEQGKHSDELTITRQLRTDLLPHTEEIQRSIGFVQLMYNHNTVKNSSMKKLKQEIQDMLSGEFGCRSSVSTLACDWLVDGDVFVSYHGMRNALLPL